MSDLLVRLHSENWIERSDAVEEIRSHPEALHSRKIQTALTDLLDREEREADESLPKDLTENRPDENGGKRAEQCLAEQCLKDTENTLAGSPKR